MVVHKLWSLWVNGGEERGRNLVVLEADLGRLNCLLLCGEGQTAHKTGLILALDPPAQTCWLAKLLIRVSGRLSEVKGQPANH